MENFNFSLYPSLSTDQKSFYLHYDCKDGIRSEWLEVHIQDLKQVGVNLKGISNASYCNGKMLYLFKGFDMSCFIRKFEYKYKKKPIMLKVDNGEHSCIRQFKKLDKKELTNLQTYV